MRAVALPEKDAVDVGNRIARHEILDLAIVVGQHDHRNVEPGAAHFAGELRGVHVADGQVGYDQIELRIGAGAVERFGAAGDMSDPGNLLQVQFERFVDEQFVEPPVFAQDERVVQARHQKNVLHLEGHEIFEAFKALLGVKNGLGNAREGHGVRKELIIAARPKQQCMQDHAA